MRTLKIKSLPSVKEESWIDRDFILLHACFQLLEDCMEQEGVDNHCNYEAHKEFVDEVRFLYNWWQQNKNAPMLDEQDEAQEMLERLIKIRQQLWT